MFEIVGMTSTDFTFYVTFLYIEVRLTDFFFCILDKLKTTAN